MCVCVVAHVRDLEEEVQELMAKIRELERTNSALHNKVFDLCTVYTYVCTCTHVHCTCTCTMYIH